MKACNFLALLFVFCITALTVPQLTAAQTGLPVFNPSNGHWFQAVESYGLCENANAAAQSMSFQDMPGHLATLTTAEENAFIATNLPVAETMRYWLGGYQDHSAPDYSEPLGGWRWVTGEPSGGR